MSLIVFDYYFDNSINELSWKNIEDNIHELLNADGVRVYGQRELYRVFNDNQECLITIYANKVRDYLLSHPVQRNVYLDCLNKRRTNIGKLISIDSCENILIFL